MISLNDINVGQIARIIDAPDDIKSLFAKFGIGIGQIVTCIAKLGPIVIQKNNQEIAIGKNLSKKIQVDAL